MNQYSITSYFIFIDCSSFKNDIFCTIFYNKRKLNNSTIIQKKMECLDILWSMTSIISRCLCLFNYHLAIFKKMRHKICYAISRICIVISLWLKLTIISHLFCLEGGGLYYVHGSVIHYLNSNTYPVYRHTAP